MTALADIITTVGTVGTGAMSGELINECDGEPELWDAHDADTESEVDFLFRIQLAARICDSCPLFMGCRRYAESFGSKAHLKLAGVLAGNYYPGPGATRAGQRARGHVIR